MAMPAPMAGAELAGNSSNGTIQDVLSTAAGTLAGSGAAVQLFADPSPYRNAVIIANNGTGKMYVGFTSDISSTKHVYRMDAQAVLVLPIGPQVPLYVRPDGTGNNYTAHEARYI